MSFPLPSADRLAASVAAPPTPFVVSVADAGPGYYSAKHILRNIHHARVHGGVAGEAYKKFKATLSSDANLRSAAEAERSSIMVTHHPVCVIAHADER